MQIGSLAGTAETSRSLPDTEAEAGLARPTGLRDAWKLVFEWTLAFLALVLLAPLMAVIIVAILIADGRPIFFGHRRVGRNGKVFLCWKFRTMAVDAEARLKQVLDNDPEAKRQYEKTWKLKVDPRVFPLGRLLRKLSLDELPQFYNILCGEMSLVGPRPATPEEVPLYGPSFIRYASVRPGLTGPWQVSGRGNLVYQERISLDAGYAVNRSLLGDLSIILRTPSAILRRTGAS